MSYLAPIFVAAAVVMAALVGLRTQEESTVAVSPLPTAGESPVVAQESPPSTPIPTPESQALNLPTWLPMLPTVQPLFSSPRPTPVPSPTLVQQSGELAISFVNLPERVRVGESFTVRWAVTGPAGRVGQSTTLTASFAKKREAEGSSSSVTSNTSQSSGSFTIPAQFDGQFSFGGTPGEVKLTATADIGGETLTSTRIVELVEQGSP